MKADIMMPIVQPGQTHLQHFRNFQVLEMTKKHAMDCPSQPQLIRLNPLTKKEDAKMNSDVLPFKKFKDHDQALDAIFTATHLGMSSVITMANKDKDFRIQTSVVFLKKSFLQLFY